MTQEELNEALEKHKLWLQANPEGKTADFSDIILHDADFHDTNLRGADFRGAEMCNSDFIGADLRHADFTAAVLNGSDFRVANMSHSDLKFANLSNSDLRDSNLRGADLHMSTLTDADLNGAKIDYASWPLTPESLRVKIDDRQAALLMYHVLSVIKYSDNVSDGVKKLALKKSAVALANRLPLIGTVEGYEPIEIGEEDEK